MSSDESDNETQRELAYQKIIQTNTNSSINSSTSNKKPNKINPWTNFLQDDEISSMLTSGSADICNNNKFYTDEFKRYSEKSIIERAGENNKFNEKDDVEAKIQSFGHQKQRRHRQNIFTGYRPKNQNTKNRYNNHSNQKSNLTYKSNRWSEKTQKNIQIAANIPYGREFRLNKRIENFTADLPDEEFKNEIAYRLREPNKRFLFSLIDIIGKDNALKFCLETEQIELAGGMPAHDHPKKKNNKNFDQKSETRTETPENSQNSTNPDNNDASNSQTVQSSPKRRKTSGGVFIALVFSNQKFDQKIIEKLRECKRNDLKNQKEAKKLAIAKAKAFKKLKEIPKRGPSETSSSGVEVETSQKSVDDNADSDGMESGECSD